MNKGVRIDVWDKFERWVLIPRRLHGTDAARLLHLRYDTLARALRGEQYLTAEILRRIEIVFGILSDQLVPPDALQPIPCGRVLERGSGLRKLRQRVPRSSTAKNPTKAPSEAPAATFGRVLGMVINSERETLQSAAKLLGLGSKGDLSAIINGRRHLTQLILKRHQVVERLRERFPTGWKLYGELVLASAAQIPEKRSKSRVGSLLKD